MSLSRQNPFCPIWWSRNAKNANSGGPETSMVDMFIRFPDMAECHVSFTENLMLFDTLESRIAKMAPEVSMNDRFYDVFW